MNNKQLSGHSGLDLPMTKMIAEVHGGDVRVQSTLGVGSTFIVSFPDTNRKDYENKIDMDKSKNIKHFCWYKRNR